MRTRASTLTRSGRAEDALMEVQLRKFSLLLACCASFTLASCNGEQTPSGAASEAPAQAPAPQTAAQVADALGKQGIVLQNIVVLDEKTDTNNLLGRPGQYTSKVFFHDSRHPKTPESGDEFEGTVEVFASPADAKKRHDYIAEVTAGMPMLLQYQFLRGNVLVRLPKAFTPSETAVYKAELEMIIPA